VSRGKNYPLVHGPNQQFKELTTQVLRRLMTYVVLWSSWTIIACVTLTARETATTEAVFIVIFIIIVITNLPSTDQDAV